MVREMKHTEIGEIPVEWKLQTFEETFCVLSNNTLPRAELNDRGGTVRNIHYGDILTRFGEVLDCEKDEVPYLNDVSSLTASAQVLQDGDVILADTAEDDSVGKATEVYGLGKGRMVAGLHTIPCRVKKGDFVPRWLGYYMNSPIYHTQVLPYVTGIKVSSISKTAISETLIAVPPLEEQMAIVSAFSEMDQLLAELKKVVSKLQDFKRGCLYLMFPQGGSDIPQMRESGYDEPWEQRKLSEITNYYNGKGHEDSQSDEGKFELINLNSISIDGGLKPSGKFVEDGRETLLENDLVMVLSDVGHGDLLGRVAIIPENNRFVLNQRVALLRITDDTNPYFLFSIINEHQAYFKKEGAGSSQLNISKATVENFVVDYPQIEEQRKIADFFSDLDHLITLHQQKINKYAQIKKAMMSELITGKIRLA